MKSEKVMKVASEMSEEEFEEMLEDLKAIGVLGEGEKKDGERTWYLTETGKAWAEGEAELSLKELAESEEVNEEDLSCSFEDLKLTGKLLEAKNLGGSGE